ncbi:arsenic metallochaperone ArsD family protein [Virgibacillus proomii]|nr:arsenic metallochaperone ArsD family protein [Virgibacillus proomii]
MKKIEIFDPLMCCSTGVCGSQCKLLTVYVEEVYE